MGVARKVHDAEPIIPGLAGGSAPHWQGTKRIMSGLSEHGSAHDDQEIEHIIPGFLMQDAQKPKPHVSDFAEDGPAQVQQTAESRSMLEFSEEGAARDEQEAKSSIPDSSENGSAEDKDATDKNHGISQDVPAPNFEGIGNADSKESSLRQRKGSRLCKVKREKLQAIVTRLVEGCRSGRALEELLALEVPKTIQKNKFMMKKLRSIMASRLI